MPRHHPCHAVNCDRQVPPRMLMCKPHWAMVPPSHKRRLWAGYVPGQERTMTPTVEYLMAAAECVQKVGQIERQPPLDIEAEVGAYMAWAEMLTDA